MILGEINMSSNGPVNKKFYHKCLQCGNVFWSNLEKPRCSHCNTRDLNLNRADRMLSSFMIEELVRRGFRVSFENIR